jgi:hypothetical protein
MRFDDTKFRDSTVKARLILRHNIDTLLKARHETRHDLAYFCRRTDAWISKILSETESDQQRGVPLKYLDRIADFFGIETYQLFQYGIDHLTERRKGNRRAPEERRIRRAFAQLSPPSGKELAAKLERLPPAARQKAEYLIDAIAVTEGVSRETGDPPGAPPLAPAPPPKGPRRLR